MIDIKPAPYDSMVEQIVLGCILQDSDLIHDIIDMVKYDDFYISNNQELYTAISYLYYNNEMIDYTSILKRLEFKKSSVPADYVLSLTDSVPSTVNFQHFVEKLLDYSHKRDMYKIGEYLLTNDISGISSSNLVKMMEESIENVNIVSNIELSDISVYSQEWLSEFYKPLNTNRMSFGIRGLDDIVGIETTGMTGIAGTTGSGKSAFALTIAKNLCLQGKHGLYLTLEMSRKQVVNRLIANMSKVSHKKIKFKEELTNGEKKAVEQAVKDIANLNLYIYDGGSMSVEHLYNLSRKLKKQKKLDFIIVDYIQLMDTGKHTGDGNESVRIGYITRKLKMLAQDLYVPIFALSQLSRSANIKEKGKKIKPELHHLKSSSSIEQDCNHVLMLHNMSDEGGIEIEDKKKSFINIYVRKNREGECGKIHTNFYGDYLEFEETKWCADEKKFIPVHQEEIKHEDMIDVDLPF